MWRKLNSCTSSGKKERCCWLGHQNSPLRGATICDNHLPPFVMTQLPWAVLTNFLWAAPWQGSPPFLTVSGSRSCPDKGKPGVSLPAGNCWPKTRVLWSVNHPHSSTHWLAFRVVVLTPRSIMSQPWYLFLWKHSSFNFFFLFSCYLPESCSKNRIKNSSPSVSLWCSFSPCWKFGWHSLPLCSVEQFYSSVH